MNILRFAWLGGVLGVLLTVALQSSADANAEPGKVVFQSPSTSYEYPVGAGNDKGNDSSISNSDFTTKERGSGHTDFENDCEQNEKDLRPQIEQTNQISANTFLTTTASNTATTEASFKPRLIYPGFTAQNVTEPTISTKDRKRRTAFEHAGEESRRISIAIRPMTAASEQTNVQVKVDQKTITSSGEGDDTKSNEVADSESEVEKKKRDCRGLPWPFVNALNATNCLELDEEEFSARLIDNRDGDDEEYEDEDDATIVLPKKRRKKPARGGNRRYQPREEDYDEDTPYDPFHSPLPRARSYHEYAMMLRDMAPNDDGYYKQGPVSYQDFHNYYRNPYEEQTNTPTGGWGWSTTPPPSGWGWTTTTAQPENQRQGKNSFGQPSQPGQAPQQPASFGQPSSGAQGKAVTFGQPGPQTQVPAPSFGQPAPVPQQVQQTPAPQTNQTAQQSSSRQGKALEFGTPSQQQVNPPPQTLAQPPTQQLQQRVGQPANPSYGTPPQQQAAYLAPGYYAPTTPAPYYGGYQQTTQAPNGWGWQETTAQPGWGWGETTTTTTTQAPPPQYQPQPQQQPSFGVQQQQQPSPTVFPIFSNYSQTTQPAPQPAPQRPQQQVLVLPITDPAQMNQTQVMDLYNRLLSLYKVVINDTNQPPQQQAAPAPVYQPPNPWQVPPPQQVWSGALAAQRGFDGYYPEEILPGIQDDYLYDAIDQPKLLPRPISPVGRRGSGRTFRRRNSRARVKDEDEPRVSFMNDGPTILHEVNNNDKFLPRRRYFKRKIDENELKKSKSKKNTPRRWGSSSDDDDLDYESEPYYPRGYKHPDVPSWLRYGNYDYQPPVYGGQPPPPESGGGWGQQPTPAPGWGWPETTTAQPGWGWPETTTTAKPGWGWGETTTTTTTQAPPQQQEGQQQETATPTEEGNQPGQQWTPPSQSPQYMAYLEQVNALIRQLQQSGQLPNYAPQQQQPTQQQQQAQQQPAQGTQLPTPQQVQQPAAQPQQVAGAPPQQDTVIEDIGRNDPTAQTPAFRDQPPTQSVRTGSARQLFSGEVQDQNMVVSTVTSTSVSESTGPTPAPGSNNTQQPPASAIQTNPQQPQQVSNAGMSTPNPQTVSAAPLNAYSSPALQQAAARQLRYSPSAMAEQTGKPSWGSWGGVQAAQQPQFSPTYSKVQDAQPYKQDEPPSYQYNILKRAGGDDSGASGFIETLSEAKKIDVGDNENSPSLVARVVD